LQAADAADLVQDVFAMVCRDIADRRGVRFRPWLWSVFQNQLMDYFRRLPHQPVGSGGTTANLRSARMRSVPLNLSP
jgi:DNA-directed RNA polymerase specialized sigma24 family protein